MKARFCLTCLRLLCVSFVSLTPAVAADIVLDNGEPGTSATGSWSSSAGTSPYNGGSLYSKQAGASYRFTVAVPSPGSYRVSMWWSGYASRPSSARVEIQHRSGAVSVQVNQQEGAGRWNELGTWSFDATAVIIIFAASTGSTCADAMLLTGDGTTPPPLEKVLDNGEPGTSATGSWSSSAGTSPYNGGSLYSKQAGASYRFTVAVPSPGSYRVSMWWSGYASRPSSARVEIQHRSGAVSVQVNQQEGAGRWNELGTWSFDATAVIIIFAASTGSTCADAVLLTGDGVSPPPYEKVLDNGQVGTAAVGYWPISGGANPYGTSSLFSKDSGSTYSYSFHVPSMGEYEVFLWWTAYPSRASSVRVDLALGTGEVKTVYVNQTTNGSRWNSLGTYSLTGTGTTTVTIRSAGVGSTCADAARIVRREGGETLPLPEPFAYWSFDEGTGTTAHDGAGDRDASIVGATWVAGRQGQALQFDDADYVVVPGVFSFGPVTFAAWVKANAGDINNNRVVTIDDGIDPDYYHFDVETCVSGGAAVNFAVSGGSIPLETINYCNVPLPADEWVQIAVTYDGAVARIYHNGGLMAEGAFTVEPRSGTLLIGGVDQPSYLAQPWDGAIDEVVFFDRAFSEDEVARLYGNISVSATAAKVNGDVVLDESEEELFKRGDSDGNGAVNLTDAVFILTYLFRAGRGPGCRKVADSDDNGELNVTDPIYLLHYLFLGGPEPREPFPACGQDLTPDGLECVNTTGC